MKADCLTQNIKIPVFLHELHGEMSNWRDVGYTYAAAFIITGFTVWLSWSAGHPFWMILLIALISLDIAGGVVSNFTAGTNNFYAAHPGKRVVFLLLHVIQPVLLAWMLPGDAILILGVMVYALALSFLIDSRRESGFQKTAAPFFTIAGISPVVLFPPEFIGLQLILVLYIVKLLLAFSVDWHNS